MNKNKIYGLAVATTLTIQPNNSLATVNMLTFKLPTHDKTIKLHCKSYGAKTTIAFNGNQQGSIRSGIVSDEPNGGVLETRPHFSNIGENTLTLSFSGKEDKIKVYCDLHEIDPNHQRLKAEDPTYKEIRKLHEINLTEADLAGKDTYELSYFIDIGQGSTTDLDPLLEELHSAITKFTHFQLGGGHPDPDIQSAPPLSMINDQIEIKYNDIKQQAMTIQKNKDGDASEFIKAKIAIFNQAMGM